MHELCPFCTDVYYLVFVLLLLLFWEYDARAATSFTYFSQESSCCVSQPNIRGQGAPMSKKVLSPRPYLLLVPPPSNWFAAEGSQKKTIFVQNCQIFAALRRLSRNFSGFVLSSPPFPPSERRNLFPPPWGSKNNSPPGRNLADPPPSCRPHAHLCSPTTNSVFCLLAGVAFWFGLQEGKGKELKVSEGRKGE